MNTKKISSENKNGNNVNTVLCAGLTFTAKSLEGEQIEMSFSEISTKYSEDDIFYYNNGIGEPVACFLSTLCVVLP
jgi:hypothetical protein